MKRILVIDDEEQIRQLLRQILEPEGYEVTEASNGNEGLEEYRKKPADLIITDLIMPEKEGFETIADLKEEYPDIKIIAISGGGLGKGAQECLYGSKKLKVSYTLVKPFDRKEFLWAVDNLLDETNKF